VDVDEPDARADPLVADMRVLVSEELAQVVLDLVSGREVDVPAFGGERVMPLAVPVETGLSESRSRRDDRRVAGCGRLAFVAAGEVVGAKRLDPACVRV